MSTIDTSTLSTATAYSNQRKIDRCQNGVQWMCFTTVDGSDRKVELHYSTNGGTTWSLGNTLSLGTTSTIPPSASIFIDQDDYLHLLYTRGSGVTYYQRGSPNTTRTMWSFSAATSAGLMGEGEMIGDIVAHRQGSGWTVHIVLTLILSGSMNVDLVIYTRFNISSGGTITKVNPIAISGNYNNNNPKFPSIDFNHNGDGKTVAGSTPHLYAAWSAGASGSGNGIRFKKATYSGGSWTWGTEVEIRSQSYLASTGGTWLNCLFDGVEVIIGGTVQDSTHVLADIFYSRNAADTTTTMKFATVSTFDYWNGSLSYDASRNVFFMGRGGATGSRDIRSTMWNRATSTLEAPTTIASTSAEEPYVSTKRGYFNEGVEFVYTNGSSSPYSIIYDVALFNDPPNAPINLSPNAVTINWGGVQDFTWTFSDPNVGDAQSSYELRYRPTGGSWTTVSGGSTQSRSFAGDTFTSGTNEWQVRTTDSSGSTGPWSAIASFVVDAPPNKSTITTPANNSIHKLTEGVTFAWTHSDPDSDPQTGWALKRREVSDNLGLGQEEWWDEVSSWVTTESVNSGSAMSKTISNWPTDIETFQIAVATSDAYGLGEYSNWITLNPWEWWNGSTWVPMQEVYITSTNEGVTIPSTMLPVGDYFWAVAVKDQAGESGPYSEDFSLNITDMLKNLHLGGVSPESLYVGDDEVVAVYLGSTMVWGT